jgi:hypothetical protein
VALSLFFHEVFHGMSGERPNRDRRTPDGWFDTAGLSSGQRDIRTHWPEEAIEDGLCEWLARTLLVRVLNRGTGWKSIPRAYLRRLPYDPEIRLIDAAVGGAADEERRLMALFRAPTAFRRFTLLSSMIWNRYGAEIPPVPPLGAYRLRRPWVRRSKRTAWTLAYPFAWHPRLHEELSWLEQEGVVPMPQRYFRLRHRSEL